MAEKIVLILSTFPDRETAHRISNQLVTEKFAACANILPAVESIYRWKDKIESGNETLVFFKLSKDRQSAFQEKLRSLHPYEVPIGIVNLAAMKLIFSEVRSQKCFVIIARHKADFLTVDLVGDFQT